MSVLPAKTMIDQKKLAVIHIVKKELALGEEEYREILEKVTGVRSARDLDDNAFLKLMRYFARSRHYRASREGITLRQKLYIRHLADDLGWDGDHLDGFLKKYHKTANLDSLDKKKASKAIESLKHILAHRER